MLFNFESQHLLLIRLIAIAIIAFNKFAGWRGSKLSELLDTPKIKMIIFHYEKGELLNNASSLSYFISYYYYNHYHFIIIIELYIPLNVQVKPNCQNSTEIQNSPKLYLISVDISIDGNYFL